MFKKIVEILLEVLRVILPFLPEKKSNNNSKLK